MARTHRTARRWLIILGTLWIVFFGAVVGVIVSQGDGVQFGFNGVAAQGDEAPEGETEAGGAGWFTEEQANRGSEAYDQHCAHCHGAELGGGVGPALAGDTFWDRWEGEAVHALYEVISETMPQDDPGSLDTGTYADVVAFVLQRNDFPTGGEELPADEERLQELTIDRAATEDAAEDEEAEGDEADASDAEGDEAAKAEDEDARAEGEEAAEAEDGADETTTTTPTELPEGPQDGRSWLDIAARPANVTINVIGAEGFVGRATSAQTLRDLAPGHYLVAASRGHEAVTSTVVLLAGEVTRIEIVLDDLSRSTDVPAPGGGFGAEMPGIAAEPAAGLRIGESPPGDAAAPEGDADGAEAGNHAAAGEAGEVGEPTTTETQADRGADPYATQCARCHGQNLAGNVAPPLAGEVFFERWAGHPVDWLYFQARTAMPPHGPAVLSAQTYADIIVFALTEAGVLQGHEEFHPDDEDFRMLVIDRRPDGDDRATDVEARVEDVRDAVHEPHQVGVAGMTALVAPMEWPDDLGIAPVGFPGRIDDAAFVQPSRLDPVEEPAGEGAPADRDDDDDDDGA